MYVLSVDDGWPSNESTCFDGCTISNVSCGLDFRMLGFGHPRLLNVGLIESIERSYLDDM